MYTVVYTMHSFIGGGNAHLVQFLTWNFTMEIFDSISCCMGYMPLPSHSLYVLIHSDESTIHLLNWHGYQGTYILQNWLQIKSTTDLTKKMLILHVWIIIQNHTLELMIYENVLSDAAAYKNTHTCMHRQKCQTYKCTHSNAATLTS